MAGNSKGKLVVSLLFVLGLLAVGYWLLNKNIKEMFFPDPISLFEEGKNIQYKFAYTGTGDKVNIISLNKGSSVFEFYHEGTGDFYIDVKTSDGKLLKVLAQTKGNFEGKTELEIPQTDAYIFDIKTTGNWGLDFK
jgi:hypothetical protein